MWTGLSDLFLMNKKRWKWCHLTSAEVIKRIASTCVFFLSLIIWSIGSQSPSCEDILKQPIEKSTWRRTEPSHQQPAPTCYPCEWTTLQVDFPAPIKLSGDYSSSYNLDCDLMIDSTLEVPSWAAPEVLTQKTEDNKCLFWG